MPERLFSTYQRDGAVVATALEPIGSLDSANFRQEADGLTTEVRTSKDNKLILDMRHAAYIGSQAIELMIRIWRHVSAATGTLVFCQLSPSAREVLQIVGLDKLWPICDTLDEALALQRSEPHAHSPHCQNRPGGAGCAGAPA